MNVILMFEGQDKIFLVKTGFVFLRLSLELDDCVNIMVPEESFGCRERICSSLRLFRSFVSSLCVCSLLSVLPLVI